jgi:uncharacterized protein YyaL (SSP411 family)
MIAEALRLAERMVEDFGDTEGGAFFQTAKDHETLLARMREGHDGAIPNANAIAARVLVRLSQHLGREDLRLLGQRAVFAYGKSIQRMPRAFSTALGVIDSLSEPSTEIVLVGAPGSPDYDALAAAVAGVYLPNRIEARIRPEAAPQALKLPLVEGKSVVPGKAALYVCRNFTCQKPITDPADVPSALGV